MYINNVSEDMQIAFNWQHEAKTAPIQAHIKRTCMHPAAAVCDAMNLTPPPMARLYHHSHKLVAERRAHSDPDAVSRCFELSAEFGFAGVIAEAATTKELLIPEQELAMHIAALAAVPAALRSLAQARELLEVCRGWRPPGGSSGQGATNREVNVWHACLQRLTVVDVLAGAPLPDASAYHLWLLAGTVMHLPNPSPAATA
jgi:hypothetical protein